MLPAMKEMPCKCKPPKRTPTCKFDGTCKEYEKWKAKLTAEQEEYRKKHQGDWLFNDNRRDRVNAYRKRMSKMK